MLDLKVHDLVSALARQEASAWQILNFSALRASRMALSDTGRIDMAMARAWKHSKLCGANAGPA